MEEQFQIVQESDLNARGFSVLSQAEKEALNLCKTEDETIYIFQLIGVVKLMPKALTFNEYEKEEQV